MSHGGKPRTVTVMRRMSLIVVLVAIPLWPVVAGLAATSRAASALPDLEVTSASIKLQGADALTGTAIVDNLGARRVRATTAAVVWTSATGKDAVELGRLKVPVLTGGQRDKAHFRVKFPDGTPGSFRVVVCADVVAQVRELGRKNHCHEAGTVKIGRSEARGSEAVKGGSSPAVVPALPALAPPAAAPPVDTTPPVVTTPPVGVTAPALTLAAPVNGSSINKNTPTFSGSAGTAPGDLPGITVRLYEGASVSGTLLQTLNTTASGAGWSVAASAALADGTYTAQASQSDSEGNTATSASSFTIDTVRPVVTLTAPADGSTTGGVPTFSGKAGTLPGDSSTVTVSLYAGSAPPAGKPVQVLSATAVQGAWSVAAASSLTEGTYTAQASQSDAADNVGTSTAITFTAIPEVTITSAPSGRLPTGPVEFTFFSKLSGDTFQCSLDGGSYSPCSSPYTISSPSPGRHTLSVRTLSAGGVAGLDPASASWDSVAPELFLCGAIPHNETLSPEDAQVYGLICNVTVEHGATLTVQPGTIIKADGGGLLTIDGRLDVTGTASEPTTFTAIEDDSVGGDTDPGAPSPAPGDWRGIDVNANGSASFLNTTLAYASTALQAAEDAEVTIHESSILHSNMGITAITFVEATKVNWGSPSGPSPIGTGTPVQGEVLVTPWVGYVDPPKPPKPPPPQAPDETTCKSIMFIGARGSGEAPSLGDFDPTNELNNMGERVRDVERGFQQTLQGQAQSSGSAELQVRPVALRYPALSTSGLSIPSLVDDYEVFKPYLENIWEGVYTLGETLSIEEARCPSEKVVLVGYSAGALVIHLALGELAGSPLISPSRIAAIVLISDPTQAGSEDVIKEGTASPAADGIYTKIFGSPPIPADLAGRTIALCDYHDLVCAPGIGSNESVHASYSAAELEPLGSAAAQELLGSP